MLTRFLSISAIAAILACSGAAMAQDKTEPAPAKADKPAKVQPKDKGDKDKDKEAAKEEITLKVGDKAPGIAVSKWVKGEPVTGFEKGKTYVVEYWATWCGPCKRAIPHITELQAKYKAKHVTFIGVSVWEDDQTLVAPFVEKMGDKMNYTIAMDDVPADSGKRGMGGKMAKTWLAAAGQHGIPCSFVVDKESKIAWIGNPLVGDIDRIVGEVADGTFDAKKEADREKQEAEKQASLVDVKKDLAKALRAKDTDKALELMDKLEKADPASAEGLHMQKFQLLMSAKKYDDAYALAAKMADKELKESPEGLNQLSWLIVDPKADVTKRDVDLAMKLAKQACELTKNENGMILDTLARCYYLKKDLDKAIEIQTKAVKFTDDEKMKDEIEATLKTYQDEKNSKK